MFFRDRKDAGLQLADAFKKYIGDDVVVFALPRGGVVLGVEIAKKLGAPLDLVFTKKIGHPGNPEYAICAMAEEGEPLCNPTEVERVDPKWFEREVLRIRTELAERRAAYFGDAKQMDVKEKTVILVDDGIATGFTMMAAIEQMRKREAKKIVIAIPVTPYRTSLKLKKLADELVSLRIDRTYLGAVGVYYRDFRQVEDAEVIALLKSFKAHEGTHETHV